MAVTFGLVTDEWKIAHYDGDDFGRAQDIVPVQVRAKFTPRIDRFDAVELPGERAWTMLLAPLEFEYREGVLVGHDGIDGVELVSAVNDVPVTWVVERTATAGGRSWSARTLEIRTQPGVPVHLPKAVEVNPEDLPRVERLWVDVSAVAAAVTAAEDARKKAQLSAGVAESAVPTVESFRDAARRASSEAHAASEAAKTTQGQVNTETSQALATLRQEGQRFASDASRSADSARSHMASAQSHAASAASAARSAAREEVNRLKAGAPEAFDTLNEIAERIKAGGSLETQILQRVSGKADVNHSHTLANITDAPNRHASTATANTLVSRDGSGRAQFATPANGNDAANKQYVDAAVATRALGTENLDTLVTTGTWGQTLNSNATSARNYPVQLAGHLEVYKVADHMVQQRYQTYQQGAADSRVFVRGRYNSTWGRWVELAAASHTHTLAQVTDAPNSHTHLSTPNTLMSRDAHGRAQVKDFPVQPHDIVNLLKLNDSLETVIRLPDLTHVIGSSQQSNKPVKTHVDGHIYSLSDPTAGNHLARKSYVDSQINTRAAASHTHTLLQITGAPNTHSSAAVTHSLVSRDGSGRAQFATPANGNDAANKQYVDDQVSGVLAVRSRDLGAVKFKRVGPVVSFSVVGLPVGNTVTVPQEFWPTGRNVDVMMTNTSNRGSGSWVTISTSGSLTASSSNGSGSLYGDGAYIIG